MTLKEELVRRAAELVPVLRERAADTEGLRQIPQETVEDFHNADLLRVATPERFGGLGFEYDVTLDIALELGRGCTSAAWCYGIWANSGWVVGMYPEKAQQEYWADSSDTLSSGGFSPARADATPVDGDTGFPGSGISAAGATPLRGRYWESWAKRGSACSSFPSRTSLLRTRGMCRG